MNFLNLTRISCINSILKPRPEGFTSDLIDVETLPLPYKHLL